MHLRVSNIQRGCVFDGPGVRTTVFLKGCNLRCPWCCNPETQSVSDDLFFDQDVCDQFRESGSRLCTSCKIKGGDRDLLNCPFCAAENSSEILLEYQLYEKLECDFPLFRHSGGGVTISGGEPLLQIHALNPFVRRLKKNGVAVCIETTLFVDTQVDELARQTDLFIVDLKLQSELGLIDNPEYYSLLSRNLASISNSGSRVVFRLVYLDSMYDCFKSIISFLRKIKVDSIELLKAHGLAKSKYTRLNLPFIDYSVKDSSKMMLFISMMRESGFAVSLLSL